MGEKGGRDCIVGGTQCDVCIVLAYSGIFIKVTAGIGLVGCGTSTPATNRLEVEDDSTWPFEVNSWTS